MAEVTVLYPKGAKFNMSYYLDSHMPLVHKRWGPLGLKGYRVLEFGDDQPYCVQATLEWGSMDEFQKAAAGEHTSEVMGDIPNFSDKEPVLIPGKVVGSA